MAIQTHPSKVVHQHRLNTLWAMGRFKKDRGKTEQLLVDAQLDMDCRVAERWALPGQEPNPNTRSSCTYACRQSEIETRDRCCRQQAHRMLEQPELNQLGSLRDRKGAQCFRSVARLSLFEVIRALTEYSRKGSFRNYSINGMYSTPGTYPTLSYGKYSIPLAMSGATFATFSGDSLK